MTPLFSLPLVSKIFVQYRRPTNSAPEFLLPPASIVLRLALMNHFDHAMSAARTFKADMSDIFAHLTKQCLKLSRDPEIVLYVLPYLALSIP